MNQNTDDRPIDLGIFNSRGRGWITSAEIVAIVLSVLWIASVVLFFTFAPEGEAGVTAAPVVFIMKFLAIFLPIAVIWVGALAARSARVMREESSRLQASIDAMRHTYLEQTHAGNLGVQPLVEKKLEEIAATAKQTETAIATFTSAREKLPQPSSDKPAIPNGKTQGTDAQTSLALGTTAEEMEPPISVSDFIRALNFPNDPDDREGFAALRRALKDRHVARLVQSAQDVLTLLSQDGIYMDDLKPEHSPPEIWRSFAKGERGQCIAPLGGVRDRSCLALATGRMRQDPIFRDVVHHFLRQFDKTFVEFEPNASDQDILALSNTRTARAFMLLGRVTGTFN